MEAKAIEEVIANAFKNKPVLVTFDTKRVAVCLFLRGQDYELLKEKNAWRVVKSHNFTKWNLTKDISLTEIINGSTIVSLKICG